MDVSPKTVREQIARAKFHLQRGDLLRTLRGLAGALLDLSGAQIFGRDRIEIGVLLEEALRQLAEQDAIKRAMPGGLPYKKGQERELAQCLTRLGDALESVLEKARVEARRRKLAELDELVLSGQEQLAKKEFLEARRIFRRAAEAHGDEPGLYADLGNRFLLAGLPAEAAEFFQRAMEAAPADQRAHFLLVQCHDALGEGLKAEDLAKGALRRFGYNESLHLRLAKGALERREWNEALTNAQAVLDQSPQSAEAGRIAAVANAKVYGEGKGREKGAPIEL